MKLKSTYILAVLMMLLLLLGSIILYKERILFVDPAYILFNIVNTKTFIISEHRYTAFITQLLPLIGVYIGIPLKFIMILYSISFYLFYSIVLLIIGFLWKQYKLGILLTLYFTIMVSDVYFWPNNEIHQGIAWMTLFLGFYFSRISHGKPIKPWQHIALIIVLFISSNSHLLVSIPLLFFWIYLHLQHKIWNTKWLNTSIIYSIIIISMIYFRYALSAHSWYDGNKLTGVKNLSIDSFYQSFSSAHSISFLQNLIHNYWIIIPMFLLGIISLIKQKKFLLMALVTITLIINYGLICITYPEAYDRSLLFYIESEWMAFSMILVTPFVINFLPSIRNKYLLPYLFVLIFAVRAFYIFDSYSFFHSRLHNLSSITHQLRTSHQAKAITEIDANSKNYFIMDWGLPVESLLLSTIQDKNNPISLKTSPEPKNYLVNSHNFLSCFKVQDIKTLNSNYFNIDSSIPYQYIPKDKIEKAYLVPLLYNLPH